MVQTALLKLSEVFEKDSGKEFKAMTLRESLEEPRSFCGPITQSRAERLVDLGNAGDYQAAMWRLNNVLTGLGSGSQTLLYPLRKWRKPMNLILFQDVIRMSSGGQRANARNGVEFPEAELSLGMWLNGSAGQFEGWKQQNVGLDFHAIFSSKRDKLSFISLHQSLNISPEFLWTYSQWRFRVPALNSFIVPFLSWPVPEVIGERGILPTSGFPQRDSRVLADESIAGIRIEHKNLDMGIQTNLVSHPMLKGGDWNAWGIANLDHGILCGIQAGFDSRTQQISSLECALFKFGTSQRSNGYLNLKHSSELGLRFRNGDTLIFNSFYHIKPVHLRQFGIDFLPFGMSIASEIAINPFARRLNYSGFSVMLATSPSFITRVYSDGDRGGVGILPWPKKGQTILPSMYVELNYKTLEIRSGLELSVGEI